MTQAASARASEGTYKTSYTAVHVRMTVTRDSDCSRPRKALVNNSLMTYSFSFPRKEAAMFVGKLFQQTIFPKVRLRFVTNVMIQGHDNLSTVMDLRGPNLHKLIGNPSHCRVS